MEKRLKVLFLCTANSCRSQMAEGWARRLRGETIEAYSAGIEPKGPDHRAVSVMAEAGVDISAQRSKALREVLEIPFDFVVTVCTDADKRCPIFPGSAKVIHVGFDDPPQLAAQAGSEEEAMAHYRRVRDEIRDFVATLPDSLLKR